MKPESTQTPQSDGTTPSKPSSGGVSRRRLVSAGIGATPVLAALKSNTVLAGGGHSCVRPSTFSSLTAAHMKVSAGREIRDDYACKSHGYWRNNQGALGDPHFKSKTKFLSYITHFNANPGNAYSGKSLQEVLELKGGNGGRHRYAALARHVTAAWLSAHTAGNPDRVLLTKAQCAALWNGLASGGTWSPFAGATWTLDQTMDYFEVVFGPAFL
jgi:hypothetical protein